MGREAIKGNPTFMEKSELLLEKKKWWKGVVQLSSVTISFI